MRSPFKFLDSFTKEDREIFFGREKEIEELYQRIFKSKIMLVYGISGTGKSSLINCGLANKFRDEDWLPVNVRRGKNMLESMYAAIVAASLTPKAQYAASDVQFQKYVKSLYLDHYKPLYFIFDQFEELFIFGTKEEKSQFVKVIKTVVDSDIQCRFIFVMREEYMANVTEFERHIPVFFSNRVRIENMDISNARQAITGPCKVANISVEEGFAEALIENLSPGSPDIELTYLQVFLDKIYRMSIEEREGNKEDNNISFTLAQLKKAGNVSDLLGTFLNEQISLLSDPDTALAVLKSFVSVKGTKRQLTLDEVKEYSQTLGRHISDSDLLEMLQNFVHLRILRDKDLHERYELRHDSLATKIFEKISGVEKDILEIRQFIEDGYHNWQKRGVLLSSGDLEYIAPYESRLFLSSELLIFISQSRNQLEKANKKRRVIFIASTFFLLVTFACFTVWALIERRKSKEQEVIANSNYLYVTSRGLLSQDPTRALKVAEYAYKRNPSLDSYQNLVDIYSNNEFYYSLVGLKQRNTPGLYYRRTFRPVGNTGKLAYAEKESIKIINSDGDLLSEWKTDKEFNDFDISRDLKYVLFHGLDDTLRLAELEGDLVCKKSTHDINYQSTYFNSGFFPDSRSFYIRYIDSTTVFSLDGKIIAGTKRFVINSSDAYFIFFDMPSSILNHLYFYSFGQDVFYKWNIEDNTIKEVKIKFPEKYASWSIVSLLPDDRLAIYTPDKKLHFFSTNGTYLLSLQLDEYPYSILPLPDKLFLGVCENSLKIWDSKSKNIKNLLINSAYRASSSIFFDSLSNKVIFSVDNRILSWNLSRNENETAFKINPDDNINLFKNNIVRNNDKGFDIYSPSGSYLWSIKLKTTMNLRFWLSKSLKSYALSERGTTSADIYDINGNRKFSIDLINQEIGDLLFSDNDSLIASIPLSWPNYITLYDSNGKELRSIGGGQGSYSTGIFSNHNKYILLISTNNIAILSDTSGRILYKLWHPSPIYGADISNDGNLVLTSCQDGSARLWNKTGNLIGIFKSDEKEPYVQGKFSDSGSLFAITDGKNLKIYDLNGHLVQAIPFKNTANAVFFSKNESELFLFDFYKGITRVSLKEPLDSFLKESSFPDLNIEDKLKYSINSFKDAYNDSDPDNLYNSGNYFLNSALLTGDPKLRPSLFDHAEKLFSRGATLDPLPARFYLKMNELLIKQSSFNGINYSSEIENIFKKLSSTNEYSELMAGLDYYFINTNSITLDYNYHKNVILLIKKLIQLYPVINRQIIYNKTTFPFDLLKYGENKEALDFCILAKECFPEDVMVNTYLPLCYLMNDSVNKAKSLYKEWEDKDLPRDYGSPREPKYGDYFRSDLRILTNTGIKVKHLEEIRAFLTDTAKMEH